MDKKLIFLDIDGTLTVPGHNTPPESALAAIREAREAGHRVFLASGRSLSALSPLLRLGFDGAVASAGVAGVSSAELVRKNFIPVIAGLIAASLFTAIML